MQLNIPPEKQQRILDAMKGVYPIPTIPDPSFSGNPANAPRIPKFTDEEWARHVIIRYIKEDVYRWEVSQASKIASDSIALDDDLVN